VEGLQLAERANPKGNARDFGVGWSEAVLAQALMRKGESLIEPKSAGEK